MALRLPDPRMVLIVVVSTAIFLGLPAWAWGSWSGFVAHPARLGACLLWVMAGLAASFSGANLGGGVGKGTPGPTGHPARDGLRPGASLAPRLRRPP